MNLTKRNKLIALITMAVMIVAVATTCILFVPSMLNKSEDTSTTSTAYAPNVQYSSNNTAAAYLSSAENCTTSIQYPSTIYMDISEDLGSVGYHFYVESNWNSGSDRRVEYFTSIFGEWAVSGGDEYQSKFSYPTNFDTNGNANTMMRIFDYKPSYEEVANCWGDRTDLCANDKVTVADGSTQVKVQSVGASSSGNFYWKYNMSGGVNATIQNSIKQNPGQDYKYIFATNQSYASHYMTYKYGWTSNTYVSNSIQYGFNSSKTGSNVTINGITSTYTTGINIEIQLYNKAPLATAIANFETKIENDKSLLNNIDANNNAYNRAKNFISDIKTNILENRYVTQKNVNDSVEAINNYKYQLAVPGTTSNNREYNDSAVSISTIFNRYLSTYYDVEIRPVVDGSESGTVSEIRDAGTYNIYVAPKSEASGLKLEWNGGGNDFKLCGEYTINPKQFSATLEDVANKQFKVSDWDIGIPGYTLNGFVSPNKNPITVQLSLEQGNFDGTDTVKVGGDREGLCAGIGTHRIHFRMTAPNHGAYESSFTVTIDKANIVLYTKEYGRTYGDDVPTSDEIIDNIIDLNRTSIFDATTSDKKKEYLQQVVTKFAIVDGGREIVVDQENHIYAAAKEGTDGYNVQLTFNSDDWQDKVANITWAVEGNKACNEQVYKIYKREVDVVWTQKANLWYDGKGGKRPTATLADSSSGVFLPGAVEALKPVTISGIIQDAGHTVELVNGEAIHAGTYEASVECADSNYKVKSTTATTTFTIKRRIIDVVVVDRNRTYADGGTTAKDVWAAYMGLFSEDDKGLVYTVSLNNTVLSSLDMFDADVVTDPLVNSATSVFKIVCNDAKYTDGTEDTRYYAVGKYTLEAVLNTEASNGWDYQLGNCTDGVFTVANATVNYTNQDLPAMTFMGKPLDFVLDKDNTDIVFQGWENEHRDGVKIYFAESEAAAKTSTSETYIQGTDAGTYDIWYRIEAPNHESQVGHVRGHIEATHIYVDVQNTASVVYGTTVPSSADLISMLNIKYYWSTDDAINESLKIENMDQRVAIGVSNGESGGGYSFFNTGDRISVNVNGAGETVGYTVSHYYLNGENPANYDFTYITSGGTPKNVNSFIVNKKDLHVDWTQSGEGWNNVDGEWKYTYSGSSPAIVAHPLAEDIAYDGIDKIAFYVSRVDGEAFEASVGKYTVTTALTKTENIRNYNLLANSMTFEIIPLTVNIEVDTITRVFGTAQQNPPLGKNIALVDPSDARSIWNYAAGSAQFIGDDYANFCFISDAITDDGTYKDVNTDGYTIKIVPLTGTTGAITNNYNPVIVNEDTAKFIITPANIHYMRRQFNISTDEEDNEDKFVTKDQIRAAISIDGISGISLDEFVVNMTDLYDDNPEGKPFIEGNQTREETNIGRYYIYILIQHERGNFNPLPAIIEVNIQSKWISVTINGAVEAEYGDPTTSSEDLWAALKDKATITGVPDPASEGAYLTGDAAWAAIKDEIGLFVGSGDTTTKLENNDAVGKYSLYFNTDSYTGDKFFRFLPLNTSDTYTSNVNAYVVTPRTLDVDWQDMDEVFGYHSTSSPSHTYDQYLKLADRDMPNTTIRTQQRYEMKVGNDWVAVNEHAVNVGEYRIVVTGVNSSNYKLPAEGLIGYFEITAREVTINLSNRGSLEYGAPRAQRGRITEYLNEIAAGTTTFTYADGSLHFVGDDEQNAVGGLFRYVLASDNGLDTKYNYYSVGTYGIDIEELNNVAAKNYNIIVNTQGSFSITAVNVTYGREQFAPRVFDGYERAFEPANDYVTLAGDSEELKKDSSYKVEYKLHSQSDAQYTTQLIVTEVGTHYIDVRVTAPNHNVAVFESRSLTIIAVNVDITMKQATKTYGDTLADMGAASLDEWLRTNCEIKFETYYLDENNQKIPHAVNLDRLNADFEFIVIQNGQGNGDTIVVGNNAVGTYGVSHEPKDSNGNDISLTYRITYAQNGEHTCNWDAYNIKRRDVNVEWVTENAVESNNVFEYNGGSAQSIKAYIELVDGTKQEVEIISSHLGSLDKDRADIIFNVGKYRATVYTDESFAINAFLHNYNPIGDTFDYTIIPKSVTINIVEGLEYTYGVAETKVGSYLDNNDLFTADGVSVGTIAQFIKLSISGNTTKQYYGVGEYDLKVEITTDNYDVEYNTVKVNVTAADIIINSHNHNASYNGKDLVLNVKEHFTEEQNYIIQGDMKWEDAEILYKQDDGTFTADLPVIKGVTSASGKSIDCKVSLDNHITREFTVVVRVAKAELVVKFSGTASSIYGDDLLGSDALFAKTAPALDEDASSMTVNLKDLITLKVFIQGSRSVLAVGSYRIDYEFINAADAELYNITLQDAQIYKVDPRELKIKWDYTTPFEYNKELHTVNALPDTDSIVAGDENNVSIICEGNRETNAGKYTATVTGVTNSNYTLGQTANLVWEIAPKKITVVWVAGEFTYDGNEHLVDVPTVESGLLAGETTEITVSGAQTNAGFHTAIASSVNTNYTVENSEYQFEIKQASLNITWGGVNGLTYNGESQAPTAEVDKTGLIGSDECEVIVDGAQINAGTHTASATLSNTNYKIAQNDTVEYVIAPKVITFTWNDEKLVYTGEKQAPTAKAEGTVKNDVVEFIIEGMEENAGEGYTAKVVGIKDNTNYILEESAKANVKNFAIGKGVNKIIFNVIPDVVDELPWLSQDDDTKPTSTWGIVEIKYYSDKDCLNEIAEPANANEGKYWIKISVAGTSNYDAVSEIIEVQLQGGFDFIPVVLGAVVTVLLLAGALAVVLVTNKKNKKQGGAV